MGIRRKPSSLASSGPLIEAAGLQPDPGLQLQTAGLGAARWLQEAVVLILLVGVVTFLLVLNLKYTPRAWHDEGAALSVAKTLVTDGVYAIHTSDGYQTFGPIQSIGPTVLLPVALSFKLFGIGLFQGRLVAVLYSLLALLAFYACGKALFSSRTAFIATLFLLASPGVGFFLYGRQVLGELPAAGLFLVGWLAWHLAIKSSRRGYLIVSGLFLGAAMVTKSQFILIGFATIALLFLLDILALHQGIWKSLIVIGVAAAACVAAWFGWQYVYYGKEVFQENAGKLRLLAASTVGLNPSNTFSALRFFLGEGSGSSYLFWGIPAFLYGAYLVISDRKQYLSVTFLLLFTALWVAYFTVWIVPWPHYALTPFVILALLVGKLFDDLLQAFLSGLKASGRSFLADRQAFQQKGALLLGTGIALLSVGLWSLYQIAWNVNAYVVDQNDRASNNLITPQQVMDPYLAANYIDANIQKGAVIETWERELDVLTNQNYHYPDQSELGASHAANYRNTVTQYALGEAYLKQSGAAYVIVGWFARWTGIYDLQYLSQHATLLQTIGQGEWRYDIYKLP